MYSGLGGYPYSTNSLWGTRTTLNPYSTYGQQRSATKSATNKQTPSKRNQMYEDKMDKQRLEHILFSGDTSNTLDQVSLDFIFITAQNRHYF